MRIEPLGDLAYILRDLPATSAQIAHAIEAAHIPGITDVVPCAKTVGVYVRSEVSLTEIKAACALAGSVAYEPRALRIPVCYELGPDLANVARTLHISASKLAELHSSAEFTCFAIGFCPGFAYLGPLPEVLRGVPRLPAPRVRTEVGSLGITGNQTAVYPLFRPGGWPIIGMTPLCLVDERDDFFPIS